MIIEKSESDCWETPTSLYDSLNKEFNFIIDLCSNGINSKCYNWSKDYLEDDLIDLRGYSCFMNPPYSNPLPFIKKAYEDSKLCRIVSLLKCDTSTKAWAVFWDYENNKPKSGVEIRFLPKRLKFERNGVPSKHSANFASVIVIFDRQGDAL